MKAFAQIPSSQHKVVAARPWKSMRSNHVFMLLTLLVFSGILGACSQKVGAPISFSNDNLQSQNFEIEGGKSQVIRGENGAILAIPANAFMDDLGNTITGKIDFRLKEANTDLAIVTGNLITQAGNQLLATGGMYQIEAFQNGKALALNPQVGIQAYLPSRGAKNAEMGLYKGESKQSKLDWKLTNQKESDIAQCDKDKASRKQCKRCNNLLKMAKRIKPGKKPPKNDYYADRYYWDNGRLYFASSGSKKPIFSQAQLDECQSFLEASEKGRELLASVDAYKKKFEAEIGEYYQYKLDALGWYNIDRAVKEDLFTFKGKVIDRDGNPVSGANVHLYCKDADLRVHTGTTTVDGNFELSFVPERNIVLYVFQDDQIGKTNYKLKANVSSQPLASVEIQPMKPEEVASFMKDML